MTDVTDQATVAEAGWPAMDGLAQRRLRRFRSVALRLAGTTSDALVCVDDAGRISFWNAAAERLLGYRRREAIGRDLTLILPAAAHDRLGLDRPRGDHSQWPRNATQTLPARRKDGEELQVELSAWRGGVGCGAGAIIRDLNGRRPPAPEGSRSSDHDQLTGLPNRVRICEEVAKAVAEGSAAAVFVVGLDGFKEVNDRLGHAVGDQVLWAVGARLKARVGAPSLVGRLGGDEFAVLIPGCAGLLAAGSIAMRLIELFADRFSIGGHVVTIEASVGVALAPEHGGTADKILANAQLALDQCKADGGQSARPFSRSMREGVESRRRLREELRWAFERGEFELHYQPQIDLRGSGRLVGAEALLRWRHPKRGLLQPALFMPLLETHPLAQPVGEWIMGEACREAAGWQRRGVSLRIGVNLFAAQFQGGRLGPAVTGALASSGLDPGLLELEITETIALKQDDELLAPLHELRALGVGIAFDDFGTGFASLVTLKHVPLTRLKIDRGFVRDLDSDRHDRAICKAVLALAQSLDLGVVAEGIETEAQAATLTAWGCDDGQGYLFGRPMPATAFLTLLGDAAAPASA